MMHGKFISAMALATAGLATAKAGQLGLPKPEVFIRAEDQERTRLLLKPCLEADVGHGCYRWDGGLARNPPCSYSIDVRRMEFLPTDQCYKMEKPRRYKGVWIDAFEDQEFIPEGAAAPDWPRIDAKSPGWRKQFDRARAATIWLDVDRAKVKHDHEESGRVMLIEFVGRKTAFPGFYGHMGMSGNEIIVDRVISLRKADLAAKRSGG